VEVVTITTIKVAEDVDIDVVIQTIIATVLQGNIVGIMVHAHNGNECNTKATGQKNEAPFMNMMGGSTRACYWINT
jgi:hypothetical protein